MTVVSSIDETNPSNDPIQDAQVAPRLGGAAEELLKLTRLGRPFHKDTADLFATFISATKLVPHRLFFKTYPRSFSTDEALQALSSLKFSQSTRSLDPEDQTTFVTTTTNYIFSMTQSVAMNLCQHFMDARYIKNALDPSLNLFKDRSLHTLTPKGLHILERFIHKTGIDADHLQEVFDTEIICPKLFHVERSTAEDEIIFSYGTIIALFRWFVGQEPNYDSKTPSGLDPVQRFTKQSNGIVLADFTADRGLLGKGVLHQDCFDAVDALEWLCDFTSVGGRDEAAEVAAHFERLGLITLVSNPDKLLRKSAIIFTVRGPPKEGNPSGRAQGEFCCVNKATYQITEKGRRIAGWDDLDGAESAFENGSNEGSSEERKALEAAKLASAADRLRHILTVPATKLLFHDFLQERFCEEHILYWSDVEAFNRKCDVTSSAISGLDVASRTSNQVKSDRRRHHNILLSKALVIYKTYLEPSGQYELNTNYALRNEIVKFLDNIPPPLGSNEGDKGARILACNPEQLQILRRYYIQVQAHTFRIMLLDSLPKFVLTEKYLALQQTTRDSDLTSVHSSSSLEVGGSYITYSSLVS